MIFRFSWRELWLIALFCTSFAAADVARACSICLPGDPIFDAQGAVAQQRGDLNAYVELRGWTKTSGELPHQEAEGEGGGEADHGHGEFNDSKRLRFLLAWTPIDRFTMSLNVPVAFNRIEEAETTISTNGLGDIALDVGYVLWRNRDVLPSTFVTGRAFLKTPTGDSRVVIDGTQDPHVQPGTGSWDFGFGLAATHKLEKAITYASTTYRINTQGSLDYEYGDVFLLNFVGLLPLGHATGISWLTRFTAGLEFNYRWADKDVFHGHDFDDSGGSILYVTPTLAMRIPWFAGRKVPSLRVAGQIPVTSSWLNGFQEEDPIWFVGLQVPIR
ncbi:MAG: transporter [Myxococcales bacterium]|nr:transporter [Myxococcales bacterium]